VHRLLALDDIESYLPFASHTPTVDDYLPLSEDAVASNTPPSIAESFTIYPEIDSVISSQNDGVALGLATWLLARAIDFAVKPPSDNDTHRMETALLDRQVQIFNRSLSGGQREGGLGHNCSAYLIGLWSVSHSPYFESYAKSKKFLGCSSWIPAFGRSTVRHRHPKISLCASSPHINIKDGHWHRK
jgi:hypothetical protein